MEQEDDFKIIPQAGQWRFYQWVNYMKHTGRLFPVLLDFRESQIHVHVNVWASLCVN